jgi:hypothetical protein
MRYAPRMATPQTAVELWPLVQGLPREERLLLAKLALRSTSNGNDAAAYAEVPVSTSEFSSDDELLGWDSAGWEEFGASG